jgi:hypothetical protein
LALAPTNGKALLRRAYSNEKQGFYKQALSDIQVSSIATQQEALLHSDFPGFMPKENLPQ